MSAIPPKSLVVFRKLVGRKLPHIRSPTAVPYPQPKTFLYMSKMYNVALAPDLPTMGGRGREG